MAASMTSVCVIIKFESNLPGQKQLLCQQRKLYIYIGSLCNKNRWKFLYDYTEFP